MGARRILPASETLRPEVETLTLVLAPHPPPSLFDQAVGPTLDFIKQRQWSPLGHGFSGFSVAVH